MKLPTSTLVKKQTSSIRKLNIHMPEVSQRSVDMIVTLRYDDQCGNGHNSFGLTVDIYAAGRRSDQARIADGCQHSLVAKYCPELAHLINWHLCSSDGPTHYLANTLYNASDRDCNGLAKGEAKQIVNGRTKQPVWECVAVDSAGKPHTVKGTSWKDADTQPESDGCLSWAPVIRIGKGKEPSLGSARASAIWPDATLEQLQDKAALEARLPGLMSEFKSAMESIGFIY